MAANVNDNMTPSNVTNSHPYSYSIRYICYIDAFNKLKPFCFTNNGYVKQKYENPFQIPEFMYYEDKNVEGWMSYDEFEKYKQIVDEFHQALEQFKKNY